MIRRTALWLLAALLGIVASAGVAWTASHLAGQRIGLSSAPPSALRGLAPELSSHGPRLPGHGPRTPRFSTPGGSSGAARSLTAPRRPGDDLSGNADGESTGPDD